MSEDPHSEPPDKPPSKGTLSLFLQYWNYGLLATLHMVVHDIFFLLFAPFLWLTSPWLWLVIPSEFFVPVTVILSFIVGSPVAGLIFMKVLPLIWPEKEILKQYPESPLDEEMIPNQPGSFLEWTTWWGRGAAALIHSLIPKIFLIAPGAVVVLAGGGAISSQAEYGHAIFFGLLVFIFLPAVTGYFFLRVFPLLWDKHVIRAAFQPRPVIKQFRPDPKKMKFPKSSSGRVKAQAKAKRKKAPKHRKSAPSSNSKAKSDDAG